MKAQKMMFKSSLVAAAFSLMFAGNAMAVTNGSFDSGLTGWDALGDVVGYSGLSNNSIAFMTTASLNYEDDFPAVAGTFNESGTAAYDIASGGFEAFAGLTAGALDTLDFAYEGSILKQTFNVNAGDTLSFNWNFYTNETLTGSDYAFVVINGALTKLANSSEATNVGALPWYAASPLELATFNQTFAAAASVTLALGVVDMTDYNVTSALRISNVTLTPVPEPETYAMLLAGLGFIVASSRRRKL